MLRIFPVAGGARFWDDFGQARPDGRTHQGNDLFAPRGTPVLAVDDGAVHVYVDPLGGNAVVLRAEDGARYYYAHLDRWAYADGTAVTAGDVLGYVGTTGNAQGTEPHLHFEVHPGGGAAQDPYPLLRKADVRDRRLKEARPRGARAGVIAVAGGLVIAAVLVVHRRPRRDA